MIGEFKFFVGLRLSQSNLKEHIGIGRYAQSNDRQVFKGPSTLCEKGHVKRQ